MRPILLGILCLMPSSTATSISGTCFLGAASARVPFSTATMSCNKMCCLGGWTWFFFRSLTGNHGRFPVKYWVQTFPSTDSGIVSLSPSHSLISESLVETNEELPWKLMEPNKNMLWKMKLRFKFGNGHFLGVVKSRRSMGMIRFFYCSTVDSHMDHMEIWLWSIW